MKTKIVFLTASILLISCRYALSISLSDKDVNSVVSNSVSGFIENKGQLCDVNYNPAPYLLFKLQDCGTDVYITEWGLSYVFKQYEENLQNSAAGNKDHSKFSDDRFKPKDIITNYCRADMELVGANIRRENIVKENESTDYFNYYLSHCPDGVTEVRSYGKITMKEVYPGIDWVIYNSVSGGMKYDFVVHPYADPSQIKLIYKWTDTPENNEGSISITTPLGIITEGKPCAYNSGNSINISYNIEDREISFNTGEYNLAETLIIDPQLLWATYYGGNQGDIGRSIYSDGTSLWVTGSTSSSNFPLQTLSGAYNQGTYGGGDNDVFILKFNISGVRQWATYYGGGGTGQDYGNSIHSDGTSVWVTGGTASVNFPLQSLSGAYNQGNFGGVTDAFILKFSISGVRSWATYYGGTGADYGYSIHIDGTSVWVTGGTFSNDFPLQNLSGAYNQGTLGGSCDVFILKFSSSGERDWATYYGGSIGGISGDQANSIRSDGTHVWVTGGTASTDFPLQTLSGAYNQGTFGGGTYDAFILKFSTSGARVWATYYGGTGSDFGYSLHRDSTSVWVTGPTASTDFPLQSLSGAYNQGTFGGGLQDAFILKFSTSGARVWATYYGGNSNDIGNSMHSDGIGVWVTGSTTSTNFPLQSLSGAYNQGTMGAYYDAFILKFTATTTGIKLISNEVPSSHKLYNNYPNPFNPTTKIKFDIPGYSGEQTTLFIYDIRGSEMAAFVNEKLNPGTYEVEWDGSNYPSGVYFYRLTSGNFADTKKMILIK